MSRIDDRIALYAAVRMQFPELHVRVRCEEEPDRPTFLVTVWGPEHPGVPWPTRTLFARTAVTDYEVLSTPPSRRRGLFDAHAYHLRRGFNRLTGAV